MASTASTFSLRETFLKWGWAAGVYLPPDRRVLERTILPYYASNPAYARILFVGVKRYTKGYARFFTDRVTYVTIDPNPSVERYGANAHVVDRVEELDHYFDEGYFDVILLNGVIGFGLNREAEVERGIAQCHRALRPGGELVLGVNDHIASHVDLTRIDALRRFKPATFLPLSLSRLVVETPFRERTHTYEFLRKT